MKCCGAVRCGAASSNTSAPPPPPPSSFSPPPSIFSDVPGQREANASARRRLPGRRRDHRAAHPLRWVVQRLAHSTTYTPAYLHPGGGHFNLISSHKQLPGPMCCTSPPPPPQKKQKTFQTPVRRQIHLMWRTSTFFHLLSMIFFSLCLI